MTRSWFPFADCLRREKGSADVEAERFAAQLFAAAEVQDPDHLHHRGAHQTRLEKSRRTQRSDGNCFKTLLISKLKYVF